MIRKPTAQGTFYPEDKKELEKEIKEYLTEKKNPAIKIAYVPHAGYVFSGKLAGKIISQVSEKKIFIIIGTNHSGLGNKISFSEKYFETPLGVIKNNQDLGEKIMRKMQDSGLDANVAEESHGEEHSIEVQLPFLQKSQKDFSIVPILIRESSLEECQKIAKILAEYLKNNSEIFLLVSGDMSHLGKAYDFQPFKDLKEGIYKYDNKILGLAIKKDSKQTYELGKRGTICGIYGLTILIEIAKILKLELSLVDYYTSGDVHKYNEKAVVGYSGVVGVSSIAKDIEN